MSTTQTTPNTPTPPTIDDYFIPDGFIYNAAIRPALPYDTSGLALKRMRALRLSSHKPYLHCTRTFQIPAFNNVQTQIRMLANTYLWGYWLFNSPSSFAGTITPHTIYVKATDGATGSGPFGDWISDQDLGCFTPVFSWAGTSGGFIQYPKFLMEPYVVTDPGLMTVEFSNNGNDNQTHLVQLQFMSCIPCDRANSAVDLGDCI